MGTWGGGRNPANHSENLAKTMRRPCEDLANNTLLAPCLRAAYTLPAGLVVAGSAGAGEVGHSRKEEADAKVPAWLTNRAQHSIAGTDFPDEPFAGNPPTQWPIKPQRTASAQTHSAESATRKTVSLSRGQAGRLPYAGAGVLHKMASRFHTE
jgi:hypothetical protein